MKKLFIGKENSTFQQILALKDNRQKRAHMGKFFVEGVQNIKDALENKWKIHALIYASESNLSNWAHSILNYADYNYVISNELMSKLSDKSNTSEILAIVDMKKDVEKSPISPTPTLTIVLDRISKKGNLGTIIRSCDALFVDQIIIYGHSVDLYDKEVITASMGSFFKLPIKVVNSIDSLENELSLLLNQCNDLQIVATSLQATNNISECDFKKPTVLVIGNETFGISKYWQDKANHLVKINMRKGIDSLNVANATTVCLYEISKQRGLN